jgi:hypothetical protein
MEKIVTKKAKSHKQPGAVPVMIIFGQDKKGKPRAGWFTSKDITPAVKAAQQLKLRFFQLDNTTKDIELAALFPEARIHAKGFNLIPIIKQELYEQLVTLAEAQPGPPPCYDVPRLSKEDLKHADGLSPKDIAEIERQLAVITDERSMFERFPANWDEIRVTSLVIANEGQSEGWWEAVVVGREGNMLFLRWRNFNGPTFVRHCSTVALLPPTEPVAKPLIS